MKRFIILCLYCVLSVTAAWGQQESRPQYLFPEFQSGQVMYNNGQVFKVELNYSLVSNRFVFIDDSDNDTIKEFSEIEKVGSVNVGKRTFLLTADGRACEVVRFEKPRIFVVYSGKKTDRGTKTAYGGRSQTSSNQTLSHYKEAGGAMYYKLEEDERFVITGIDKVYHFGESDKMKKFSTLKQLLNICPKEARPAIEEFAKGNATDFDSVEQVVKLCEYVYSLM